MAWTSANPQLVSVENGVITAVAPTPAGPVRVTVASVENPGVYAHIDITVNASPPLQDLSLYPVSETLFVGETVTPIVTRHPAAAIAEALKWVSANPSIASVSPSGVITGVSIGDPVRVTVTAVENPGVYAYIDVTVVSRPPLEELTLNLVSTTLFVGETVTPIVTRHPAAATEETLKWISADPTVASVLPSGVITGESAGGPVRITVTAVENQDVYAYIDITVVSRPPLESITLNTNSENLSVGETLAPIVIRYPAAATVEALEWVSANPSIASVLPNGAITGVSIGGPVRVTVRAEGNPYITAHIDITVVGLPSLRYIWAEHFPLGNIVAATNYTWQGPIGSGHVADIGNPTREAMLRRHFSILTAENAMKPDALQPQPGWFTFTNPNSSANRIRTFANSNGMGLHGHVLVWHSQSPWHLNQTSQGGNPIDRDDAIENLVNHIERVMRHFGTGVESWEVLNEIFASGGGPAVVGGNWRNNLRNYTPGGPPHGTGTPWARAIGTRPHTTHDPNRYCYIWIAFTTARRVADEIDSGAGRPLGTMLLYYNDYNEENPNKRAAIYYMVREMNTRFAAQNNGRILIDVIGMQAHYHRSGSGSAFPWGPTNVNNVRLSLERFASLIGQGLLRHVSITELDITVGGVQANPQPNPNNALPPNPPLTAQQERDQAIMYAQLFRVFRDNHASLRRVSIWGMNDNASWRWRGHPLLWDANLQPKEAFWAVAAPDAFVNPANGQPRPAAEINAFLANPRARASDLGLIPLGAWE
ncbi:MAG: endo-1,4-beta-xylanase [Treponema sp.]|nr:endo-1,4-beta-xylanase [Treponema sp.]